jgi:hypothetical protein
MQDEVKSVKSGKYTLVARIYEGKYHGFLWHDGKVIEDDLAGSLDDAWTKVCGRLYSRLSQDADARKDLPPNASEAKQAFLNIEARLSLGQKAMLRNHMNAKGRCLTATQLATAAGYKGFSAANLHYGLLGAMLYGEMPRPLPTRSDGSPVMTYMIADGLDQGEKSEGEWIWRMRDDIADGLTAAGTHSGQIPSC